MKSQSQIVDDARLKEARRAAAQARRMAKTYRADDATAWSQAAALVANELTRRAVQLEEANTLIPKPTQAMYTIYRYPTDFPQHYVVRRHGIFAGHDKPRASLSWCMLADDVEEARELIPQGCALIPRDPSDEPHIVESWL